VCVCVWLSVCVCVYVCVCVCVCARARVRRKGHAASSFNDSHVLSTPPILMPPDQRARSRFEKRTRFRLERGAHKYAVITDMIMVVVAVVVVVVHCPSSGGSLHVIVRGGARDSVQYSTSRPTIHVAPHHHPFTYLVQCGMCNVLSCVSSKCACWKSLKNIMVYKVELNSAVTTIHNDCCR
jgi:hypothetical protein